MTYAALIVCMLVLAVFNRMRGNKDAWIPSLPGRALWYVTCIILASTLALLPWAHAALFSLGYLWFYTLPIGRWYTLNREPREISGEPNAFERAVERVVDIEGRNDDGALFVRNLIGVLPWALLAAYSNLYTWMVALTLPLLGIMVREAAWRMTWARRNEIAVGELLEGALIGVLLWTTIGA